MHRLIVLLFLFLPWGLAAQNYDTLIQEAVRSRNSGDLLTAESKLRDAYRIAEDKREAAYLLALVLAFQEKFSAAMALIEEALHGDPENIDLLLAKARVQSYQGQYAEAVETVDRVLAQAPNHVEARNLGGRIALYRNQAERGRNQFLEVLEQVPDNLEAVIGLHDAELALGNDERAEYWLDRAESIAPGHVDVRQRRERRAAPDVPRHEVLAGFGVSRFDVSGFSRWRDRFVEYRHGVAGENQQFLRFEHAHRFGLHDSLWELGASFNSDGSVPFEVAAGAGKDKLFLPRTRFRVGVRFNLNEGSENLGASVGHLTFRQSRYITGTTRQLFFDVEHYFVETNGWIVPGIGVTRDEAGKSTFSWKLGLNFQPHARWRWGAAWIDAPETENNVTTDTETLHVYVRYRASRKVAVRVDYARNDRLGSYTRSGLDLTLSYRF